MPAPDALAREIADLKRRLAALERSSQLAYSTIPDADGNHVNVVDSILAGLASEAIAADALARATSAEAKADGAVTVFYQPDAPASPSTGDFWVDTDDGSKASTWDGTTWVPLTSQDVANALAAAQSAQAAADGKIVTFWQADPPTATAVGDIWYDTDAGNTITRWNGTAWVPLLVGSGALENQAVTGDKLAADVAIVGAVRSPNYAAGSAGWTINGDGTSEFNNAVFRGTVEVGEAPNPQVRARQSGNSGLVEIPTNSPSESAPATVSGTVFNPGVSTEHLALQLAGPREAAPSDGGVRLDLVSQNRDGSSNASFSVVDTKTNTPFITADKTVLRIPGNFDMSGDATVNGTFFPHGDLWQSASKKCFTGELIPANVTAFRANITPVANTPTSLTYSGLGLTAGLAGYEAFATAQTSVIGSTVQGVACDQASASSVRVWVYRSNTTATGISVMVWGHS